MGRGREDLISISSSRTKNHLQFDIPLTDLARDIIGPQQERKYVFGRYSTSGGFGGFSKAKVELDAKLKGVKPGGCMTSGTRFQPACTANLASSRTVRLARSRARMASHPRRSWRDASLPDHRIEIEDIEDTHLQADVETWCELARALAEFLDARRSA